jgi:hypothetical protein
MTGIVEIFTTVVCNTKEILNFLSQSNSGERIIAQERGSQSGETTNQS